MAAEPDAPAPLCQVVVTGARIAGASDADVLPRLQQAFRLAPEQAAALLKGPRTVKRGIDPASAARLVRALAGAGLVAVVERIGPVPAAPPAADADRTAPVSPLDRLRALAAQPLPRPAVDRAYALRLALVTALCVAIPVAYAALTGALAVGWAWYLMNLHQHLPTYHWQAVVLLYAIPGLSGGVLVLFLLRPLFARRAARSQPVRLDGAAEPDLVEAVHALCRAVGVAPPGDIHLTWQANAWVNFRGGWLGLLRGEKDLTIGVPLLTALSARELIGVLAHEFGHFAQRSGMASSFLINSVNRWIEHRAYGPDPLEERVRRAAAESENWYVALPAQLAWLCVQGARKLMAGLFALSFRLSRSLSRQMEFDADRYEALVAGSEAFAVTARKLRGLSEAFEEVEQSNITAWHEGRLLRDVPEAVTWRFRGFDAARLEAAPAEGEEVTRFWDSHPPDALRIANAEAQQAPGLFRDGAPAARLVRDPRRWGQAVTRAYYASLGLRYTPEQLRSREEILGLAEGRDYGREQVDRYFNVQFQPWPLLDLALRPGPAEGLAWQALIDQLRRRSPEFTRAWSDAFEASRLRARLRLATELELDSQALELPGTPRGPAELGHEREQLLERRGGCYGVLADCFDLYARRVMAAIDSMAEPQRAKAGALRAALVQLHGLEARIGAVAELTEVAAMLQRAIEGGAPNAAARLSAVGAEYAGELLALMEALDRIAQDVTAGGTVGGYLRTRCPLLLREGGSRAPEALLRGATGLPDALDHFYRLALGELVILCSAAESARGIRPIRLVR